MGQQSVIERSMLKDTLDDSLGRVSQPGRENL
jgi:hypothetical protein